MAPVSELVYYIFQPFTREEHLQQQSRLQYGLQQLEVLYVRAYGFVLTVSLPEEEDKSSAVQV